MIFNNEILNPTPDKREREVIEQGETKLFSLSSENSEPNKEKILICGRDMGIARTLSPVVKILEQKGYNLSILTDKPAENHFVKEFNVEEEEIDSLLNTVEKVKPNLVLSGVSASGGPGLEYYGIKTAEGQHDKEHIPSVVVEDFWGSSTRSKQLEYNVFPDIVCTFDEYSKLINKDNLYSAGIKNVDESRFIITGSPTFDEIKEEKNREEINEKVRSAFKLKSSDNIISFMGQLPPDDLENLKLFINSLLKISDKAGSDSGLVLAPRIHPHIFTKQQYNNYKNQYKEIFNSLSGSNIKLIETADQFTTDDVAIASDTVVSSYSTEGVKAVYRGKMALFMLLPGLGQKSIKTDYGIDSLPPIDQGAAAGVFKEETLQKTLEKILFDKEYQKNIKNNQKLNFNLDGKNTDRVIKVIEKILSENK